MDLQAPDELIRRIQAELDAEYAAERAAAQPARRSRRRWPMLAAAAALVLLGAIAGQMLTIRTTSSDLAITVPNAADPGSAAVEETSDGDGFVFGIQPAGAAPLDELALALLEAEEPVTAFRDAGQVVAGELDAAVVDSVVRTDASRTDGRIAKLHHVERLGPWPTQPLVASTRLAEEHVAELRDALLASNDDPRMQAELANASLTRFVKVEADHYAPVRQALERF